MTNEDKTLAFWTDGVILILCDGRSKSLTSLKRGIAVSNSRMKAVVQAIESLERTGPALGRPLVDTIEGSRIANLKDLRPKRNDIRVLFVFDPRRTGILLIGGSKTNDWRGWYERNIPEAERLYKEGLV